MARTNIEKEIQQIKERNKRVEADKAWEVSFARRSLITAGTYVIVVIFLFSIGAPNPWTNAFVPTIGYILSTLSLPFVKKLWIKRRYER